MADKPENMQKYENYKEQFKRLNKAMNYQFYLEAMFIAYAIIEDRTESILRHAGKWEQCVKRSRNGKPGIHFKIKKIKNLADQNVSLLNKYFSDDLLDNILEWKDERNRMMHALMKQSLTTEILESLAVQGKEYARTLANRSGNFSRAIEREERKSK